MLLLRMPRKPRKGAWSPRGSVENVGLFVNFPYEIRHDLVEIFGDKTSLTVVYGLPPVVLPMLLH